MAIKNDFRQHFNFKIIAGLLLIFINQKLQSQTTPSWSTQFDYLGYGYVKATVELPNGDLLLARNNNYQSVSQPPTLLRYNKITEQLTSENGTGFTLNSITDLKLDGDTMLYLAGLLNDFNGTYAVLKKNINSSTWQQVCQTNGIISCLELYNNKLFIGGVYTSINGNNFIALSTYNILNNTIDSVPGKLFTTAYSPDVRCMKKNGSGLIIGGFFLKAGADTLNSIAIYDNTGWHSLNKGLRFKQSNSYSAGRIYCINTDPSNPQNITVGGDFNFFNQTQFSITDQNNIAIWKNGISAWDTVPHFKSARNSPIAPYYLNDLRYYNNDLYLAYGQPNTNGNAIIKLTNSNWSLLPIVFKNELYGGCSLSEYQGDLLISSYFAKPMHGTLRYHYDGTFRSFGLGLGSVCGSFYDAVIQARSGDDIYISNGGNIANDNPYVMSGGACSSIDLLKFNLNTLIYDSIHSNFYGIINSLCAKGDSLVILGSIQTNIYSPGTQFNCGAIYNTNTKSLSPLIAPNYTIDYTVGGYGPYLESIAFYGNGFFIGGQFKINNDNNLQNLVYWNGSSFDSLKFMPHNNTDIKTLEITNDTLWVGGQFKLYNNIQNFAAYKISTKQWINSSSLADYGSGPAQVKKIKIYKDKIFVAGNYLHRRVPFGGAPIALPDTSGSAGYFERGNLNNYHPFTQFKKNSYPFFENVYVKNDSIIYLMGYQTYKSTKCNSSNLNCDSTGGILKYNYLTNKFRSYFQGGVETTNWTASLGVSFMTEQNNQHYLFGSFQNLTNGIHSKHIASNNWEADITTSLSENTKIVDEINLFIFPNPTNGIFTVKLNNPIKHAEVYDVVGNLILKSNNHIIDIRNASSGIYTVKVVDAANNIYVKKVILNQ